MPVTIFCRPPLASIHVGDISRRPVRREHGISDNQPDNSQSFLQLEFGEVKKNRFAKTLIILIRRGGRGTGME